MDHETSGCDGRCVRERGDLGGSSGEDDEYGFNEFEFESIHVSNLVCLQCYRRWLSRRSDERCITHSAQNECNRQCVELISYSPFTDPANPSDPSTLFTQRALISSPPSGHPQLPHYHASSGDGSPLTSLMRRSLNSVGAKLEQSGVERFGMNAETGKKGFEGVLREVEERLKGRGYLEGMGWPSLGRDDIRAEETV